MIDDSRDGGGNISQFQPHPPPACAQRLLGAKSVSRSEYADATVSHRSAAGVIGFGTDVRSRCREVNT